MSNKYQVLPGNPYPFGCIRKGNDLHFSAQYHGGISCGINLYDKKSGRKQLIILTDNQRCGRVYSAQIKDAASDYDSYLLYEDGRLFCDPYAQRIFGLEKWGSYVPEKELRCGFGQDYPVKNSGHNHIPYEKSFLYLVHVRGYTMSPTSGVAQPLRGTFDGLVQKIPYLQSLGVTAVELMPVYEMQSVDEKKYNGTSDQKNDTMASSGPGSSYLISENGSIRSAESGKKKINFWGYSDGYYFTPRAAYCSNPEDPKAEFRRMMHAFHEAGMEVILQFYFPETVPEQQMIDVLHFWILCYEIDGIHLKGARIPNQMIASDPILSDCKLMNYGFDYDRVYGKNHTAPVFRSLAEYKDDFLYTARRFLKGDDSTLGAFLNAMHLNAADHGTINYICNYEGFRLHDLVSYEHKHNEANGEENCDGQDENCSWNCGVEGPSRKKAVCQLRNRQIRNILTMLFLAQGTPMLFGGDEFCNSQNGNNNPYCQDNPTGWIDWSAKNHNEEIFNYVLFLSKLRANSPLFHQSHPFRLMDHLACGYPDFSYHGVEAWRPDLSDYSHSIGMLYCGFYTPEEADHSFYYIAYNMHWKPVTFALPRLPDQMKWYLLSDTASGQISETPELLLHQEQVLCDARSVCIYVGKGECKLPKVRERQAF